MSTVTERSTAYLKAREQAGLAGVEWLRTLAHLHQGPRYSEAEETIYLDAHAQGFDDARRWLCEEILAARAIESQAPAGQVKA